MYAIIVYVNPYCLIEALIHRNVDLEFFRQDELCPKKILDFESSFLQSLEGI